MAKKEYDTRRTSEYGPRIVNMQEMLTILNTSTPTIKKYMQQGCPVLQDSGGKPGQGYIFDIHDVINWLVERERKKVEKKLSKYAGGDGEEGTTKQQLESAKARKEKAHANRAELELAEKMGHVVRQDVLLRCFESALINARTNLLAIPAKAAPSLVYLDTAPTIQAKLEDMITQCLNDLTAEAIKKDAENKIQAAE